MEPTRHEREALEAAQLIMYVNDIKHPDSDIVGRKVKRGRSIRTITGTYDDIPGGVRLDSPIEGFVSWNLDSLTLPPRVIKIKI